jgi:acyl dehydratase
MRKYVDFGKLSVGESLPSLTKESITKIQLVRYAGASGDFNPIHTDDTEAQKAGLKGVIAQGPLIMGFVGQAIARWVPKRDLKRFKVRFMGMTYPGDVITVSASVAEKTKTNDGVRVVCETVAKDQHGQAKLSGQFEVFVPIEEGGGI